MNPMFDMPLSDAHAHLSTDDALTELVQRRERNVLTCFSTGTPTEWERVNGLLASIDTGESAPFLMSFGIHPWESERYEASACEQAYTQCAAIGEIGLDTVWCDVPLARQTTVFERQLQLATDMHKPIVLHTKGAETLVADMVRGFPEPVLVHWYSGPLDAFERFADQDCYFTLGPDCSNGSELNRTLLTALPLKRTLIETDGIEGVTWAIDENPRIAQSIARFYDQNASLIEAALTTSIHTLAEARNIAPQSIATQLQQNMQRFYTNGRTERTTATISAL